MDAAADPDDLAAAEKKQLADAGAGAPGNVWEGNPDFKCETCEGYASSHFAEHCDICILEDLETEEAASDDAAADPDDLASARMLEKIMEELATGEARCKEMEKQLAAAGAVEGDGAVEVWTQTDAPAEVPAADLHDINILMMIKKQFDLNLEKYEAEFSSLTACDADGTPRWVLTGVQRKCWNCDAAYMQKEEWENEIEMNFCELEDSIYDDIEVIYKESSTINWN
jgi:hypothetical protein